jgi:hypothetical protein
MHVDPSPAIVQVTSENFDRMLPEVSSALSKSDFIAFHCKMTDQKFQPSKWDDMAARYGKVCTYLVSPVYNNVVATASAARLTCALKCRHSCKHQ